MQTDEKLNLYGVIAPYCFLLCKSALASLKPGAILEIHLSDPQTLEDLLIILDRSGEKILSSVQYGESTRLRVQRGGISQVESA
ncbi:MAG: sulfurtransferase TusA family protein [Syntrophobacteraceae bacterium]